MQHKLLPGCWVIVCDGSKALILENKGDEKFPNLRSLESHTQKDFLTRELGTDRPTRIHHSGAPAQGTIEQTDLHDKAEREFLESLAKRLHLNVSACKPKHLVIFAPARALGMLRPVYSDALRLALIGEIEKDYVKMPIHEIEKRVVAELAA